MGYGADVIFRASGIAFWQNTEFKTSNQPMMMLLFLWYSHRRIERESSHKWATR